MQLVQKFARRYHVKYIYILYIYRYHRRKKIYFLVNHMQNKTNHELNKESYLLLQPVIFSVSMNGEWRIVK